MFCVDLKKQKKRVPLPAFKDFCDSVPPFFIWSVLFRHANQTLSLLPSDKFKVH